MAKKTHMSIHEIEDYVDRLEREDPPEDTDDQYNYDFDEDYYPRNTPSGLLNGKKSYE